MANKYIGTFCRNCRYYKPNEDDRNVATLMDYDGWCLKGRYFNGRKVGDKAKVKEFHGQGCTHWEHHYWGITHFEAKCHIPEAKRSEREIEYLGQFIEWRDRSEWINREE